MTTALLASLGYLLSIALLHTNNRRRNFIIAVFMLSAFVAHAQPLFNSFAHAINNAAFTQILSLISLCMAIIGAWRYFKNKDKLIYTVVALTAAICVWLPVLIQLPITEVSHWGLKIHVALSIAAYITLAFAALYAVLLIIQDHRLKTGKGIFNLKMPLNYLERAMLSFTIAGELLLSLSLATGVLFIHDLWGQHVAHKVVFGAVSWLIIAILLIRHYRYGFRGRRAALWLLGGFICLALAYFGSAIVLQILLTH